MSELIDRVAALVPAATGEDCVRVAVDGVDGAGKTTFARQLAAALQQRGRPVVQVSVDDFHYPRAVRYTATYLGNSCTSRPASRGRAPRS